MTVTDTDITTEGRSSHGVFVQHAGDDTANIFINVDGSGGSRTFRTSGYNAYGVRGYRDVGTDGLGTGNVTIDVRDLRIITTGPRGRGIDAYHTGTGDIDVDVAGGSIGTSGELAYGIRARHQPQTKDEDDNFILRAGDITIDVEDLTITTRGVAADGIQGFHENDGDLIIEAARRHDQDAKHGYLQGNRHPVKGHLWRAYRRRRRDNRSSRRLYHDARDVFVRYRWSSFRRWQYRHLDRGRPHHHHDGRQRPRHRRLSLRHRGLQDHNDHGRGPHRRQRGGRPRRPGGHAQQRRPYTRHRDRCRRLSPAVGHR